MLLNMKNKIKLLISKNSMPLGGAETLIIQHLDNIDRARFEVHFITNTSKGELLSITKEKADYYMCLNRKFVLDPIPILKLRKYLIRNSINIVHSHDWVSALFLLLASWGLKVLKISTTHAQNRTWRNYVNLKVLKKFNLNIICVSKSQRIDFFEKGVPWEKMAVVYNCFDFKKFDRSYKCKRYEKNGAFKVVMVGNYCWQKDQKTLIDAINIIKHHGYNIELHLVGGRSIERLKQCKSLVKKLSLNSIVYFYNHKKVDSDFLSQFDLFVFSSKSETFGIVSVEAMACGMPVLVSDIPPNMEIIRFGKDGLYFETGNSKSCAEEIIKVINDRLLLKALGEKAYDRAKDFHPQKVVSELEDQYQKQLNSCKSYEIFND